MGCGCNGGKKTLPKKQAQAAPAPAATSGGKRFVLIHSGGGRTYFQTEAQARAANQAAGNRGLVRPA